MTRWELEGQVKHYFADELEKDAEMTGAQFIVKFLEHKGVTQIYGIPGAAILPFYDAVLGQDLIRSISVRHEQTAIFMADGYARSTGKVGICAAASGPGATNFLTGLYSAYGDSVPLIAFTGQVETDLIGKEAFQEAPIVEMAKPVTKAAYLVTETDDLPRVMNEAWKLANMGRKGPVLIDIPVNIQLGQLKLNLKEYFKEEKQVPNNLGQATDSQLEIVYKMLEEAKRPVIMVGGGIAGRAAEDLVRLAQLLQIPVVSSILGKEGFPNYHPLYAGMVGTICQTPLGNKTISEADLIINLGGRFDYRSMGEITLLTEERKVINVNKEDDNLSESAPVDLTIVSDIKGFIQSFSSYILGCKYKPKTEAMDRIVALQKEKARIARQTNFTENPSKSLQAILEVRKGLRPDAIVALDSELSQLWASQLNEMYESRTFLITGCAGSKGWGLGASMGAQLAYPQRQVINIMKDASLSISLQELATAAKNLIPIVILVFNHDQSRQNGLDFVSAAKGLGVEAESVERINQIPGALTRGFSAYRPYLIEVMVNSEEQRLASSGGVA